MLPGPDLGHSSVAITPNQYTGAEEPEATGAVGSRWHAEIFALTRRMRERTDPHMGSDRVETAVNVIAGVPDNWPRASNRLRQLHTQGY